MNTPAQTPATDLHHALCVRPPSRFCQLHPTTQSPVGLRAATCERQTLLRIQSLCTSERHCRVPLLCQPPQLCPVPTASMVTSDAVPGPSRADTNVHTAATNGDADAAGPSRRRSRSRAEAGDATPGSNTPRRPHSPDTTLSRHASPAREATPHLDLATYPTPTLLRLLASLLQQIASANDQLRAEHDDDPPSGGGGGSGGGGDHMEVVSDTAPHAEDASATGSTQSRSSMAHPSPTTALFHDDPPLFPDLAAGDRLFTASKVSLSHPSSILSFHARHVPSISIEAYLLRILKYCPTTNEVFLGLLVYFDRMSKLGTPAGVGGTSAAVGPRGFAIDSYNVHRLIIAGVTVASKFFSGECEGRERGRVLTPCRRRLLYQFALRQGWRTPTTRVEPA